MQHRRARGGRPRSGNQRILRSCAPRGRRGLRALCDLQRRGTARPLGHRCAGCGDRAGWLAQTGGLWAGRSCRNIVVFPGQVVSLFVGRQKSVAALEAAMEGDKDIFLLAQLDPGTDDPTDDELYDVGVVAQVLQLLKMPDGTVRVLVEGGSRA